ncbi:S-adenosyl-L-methionine-dependent methyltransferase [Naematelia encephala]|uniref:S-adenosyl-L-methionine-dependent methyltransferase n=1 Tax=Naematelia encephala TaxID=71784 RepID=A0A1Y2AZP8_9TREE|nr:S-adenosyl-L-methionine-dependent methyltransferase [Naematelia encephala]
MSTGTHHQHHHGHHHHHHQHDHQHQDDPWNGVEYLSKPGVRETAIIQADSVSHALIHAGVPLSSQKELHVLEIGCGGGAVTPHLLSMFCTVHSIDTSLSMLLALPPYPPSHTHALHSLSSSSAAQFKALEPMRSPIPTDQARTQVPPRTEWDIAVTNLVMHHVDDIPSFLRGAIGLLKVDGWLVVTEFGPSELIEGTGTGSDTAPEHHVHDTDENGHGNTVNKPLHHRPAWSIETISKVLLDNGFVDVGAEIRGTLPVFGLDKPPVPCLIAWGRKP